MSRSSNPLTNAIQSLLRHLLTDTSGDYPWSVESMCIEKRGDFFPHVRAFKPICQGTVTVNYGARGDLEVQQVTRVDLYVFDSPDGTGMAVNLKLRRVRGDGNTAKDFGPVIESGVVAPYPVLDWPRVLSDMAKELEDLTGHLHVAAVRTLHILEVDESTQDPDSGPLDKSAQSQP